ncbi:MAG: hypothetical protein K2I86_05780 [Prevotella sp.]|nr:hypothetical protein [Prevotella sp.]
MNRLVATILVGCIVSALWAADGHLQRINAIKKNADYLYGEATMAVQADAASLAYEQLQKQVFDWAQRDSITLKVRSVTEINRLADTLMMRRAEMYRVFVYVRKSDLTEPSVQPQDTLATDSVKPMSTDSVKSLVNDSVRQVIRQRFSGKKNRQNDALLRIKEAKNFFELKAIMQPLKERGDIIDYGKYATAKQPEQCYLIVYDPAGNIRALLGKGDNVRKNLKTGSDDGISNYRGCGAIWFTLNEK